MKKEIKKQLREKLTADIYYCIASGLLLKETKARARELCLLYFPKAEELLLTAVETLADRMQNLYYSKEDFEFAIKDYKTTRSNQNDK